MYNILICDDEQDIVNALLIYLKDDNYNLLTAINGEDAINITKSTEIHLILMDIMMPKIDGINAMVKIREFATMPIILLTAKSEDTDKILGLTVGADDYITKPFNPLEVTARVKSQLRRYLHLGSKITNDNKIIIDGIELDDDKKSVTLEGEEVALTPLEYDILKLIMQNPNKVYSPKEIYSNIWKETLTGNENSVAVHIRHLREKIEIDPSNPRYIKVVWGKGYMFSK